MLKRRSGRPYLYGRGHDSTNRTGRRGRGTIAAGMIAGYQHWPVFMTWAVQTGDVEVGEPFELHREHLGGAGCKCWDVRRVQNQGHAVGHLSVCGGGESPFETSNGAVGTTVNNGERTIREAD